MKGFIFTLDAVFALIIAAIGTSVLLYVDFTGAGSYSIASSQAYTAMQSMLQTTVAGASGGSLYINYLLASSYGSTFSWQQLGHDAALSSGTGYSLQAPFLLYTFTTPNMANVLPAVVVNSGFAAVTAHNTVYLINATTGNLIRISATSTKIVGAPAIYMNMLFYANSTNTVRGVNLYNTSIQWKFNAVNSVTTPMEIENNYLAFGTSNGFYLLNPISGNQVAFAGTGAPVQAPVYLDGEYIVSTNPKSGNGALYSYSLNGGSFTNIWNSILGTPTTQPSSINNTVAVGSGGYLYVFSPSGKQQFPKINLASKVLGIGSYGSSYYVQTLSELYVFSDTGKELFNSITTTDAQNSIPSVGGASSVYELINGNSFVGYNISLNSSFDINLQSNYEYVNYSNIALAYGNAYVPNGNTVYVFGTYKPQPNDNILQTLASMYLNNQGDYSNFVLGSLYDSNTTGIFINDTYAPDLSVATFNAASSSYIEQTGGFSWINNAMAQYTISIWVDPASGNGVMVDELGQRQPGTAWHNSSIELVDGYAFMRLSGSCANIGRVNTSSWSNIVVTYNGSTEKGYINGALSANSINKIRKVPGQGALMYYPIGVGDSNNCGSGAYFSGSMLNYQIYNVTLSSKEVSEIYNQGAFSNPVNQQDIGLWLPLLGNSNDFSGAFDFGIPYNIKYAETSYLPAGFLNAYQVSEASVPLFLDVNGTNMEYNVSVVTWH